MTEAEYIKTIKKVSSPRVYKVKNSYGVKNYYRYYRKNKPKDPKYRLTDSQYFAIIRRVNEKLRDSLLAGSNIIFPAKMGVLKLKKQEVTYKKTDKGYTTNLPIDWNSTLKLWYADPECAKEKTLVRFNADYLYYILYNNFTATYKNKVYYEFDINRTFKQMLNKALKETYLDAFKY